MQIAPHGKDEWIAAVLLPAKVFFAAFLFLSFLDFPINDAPQGTGKVLGVCFMSSPPILILGALVQSIFCKRGAATKTLLFFLFITVSAFFMGRFGSGGVFIPVLCWIFWRLTYSIRQTERTSKEPAEQIECLDCHAAIPAGQSSCPSCGWTFKK